MRNVAQSAQRVIGPTGLVGELHGIRDGRAPIVLLHGLSFDRRIWDPVLHELVRVDPRRQVLCIDLHGHGESEDPWSWDLPTATESLHTTIVELGLEEPDGLPPVLVGHSAGGMLATMYAAHFRTSGVVNVDCVLDLTAFSAGLQSMQAALRGLGFNSLWRQISAGFGTDELPLDQQDLVHSYGPPRQEVALGFWGDLLLRPTEEITAEVRAVLAAIRARGVPYQVVTSRALPWRYRRWLLAQLPELSREVIPGGGHFPMLADPRRFARLLAETSQWSASAAGFVQEGRH